MFSLPEVRLTQQFVKLSWFLALDYLLKGSYSGVELSNFMGKFAYRHQVISFLIQRILSRRLIFHYCQSWLIPFDRLRVLSLHLIHQSQFSVGCWRFFEVESLLVIQQRLDIRFPLGQTVSQLDIRLIIFLRIEGGLVSPHRTLEITLDWLVDFAQPCQSLSIGGILFQNFAESTQKYLSSSMACLDEISLMMDATSMSEGM